MSIWGYTTERSKAMSTFDFGEGPVPAHRHGNRDCTPGGWVADTASVADTVRVAGNARLYGDAKVRGNARVTGTASVAGNAHVHGHTCVAGNALVAGNAEVSGDARVTENAKVYGYAQVSGSARVYEKAKVCENAKVYGFSRVSGNAKLSGDARAHGGVHVHGDASVMERYHLVHIDGLGENGGLTMFRTAGGGHMIQAGCWSGTLAAMRDNLAMPHAHGWDNPERCETQYLSVLPLLAAHKKLWKREG